MCIKPKSNCIEARNGLHEIKYHFEQSCLSSISTTQRDHSFTKSKLVNNHFQVTALFYISYYASSDTGRWKFVRISFKYTTYNPRMQRLGIAQNA